MPSTVTQVPVLLLAALPVGASALAPAAACGGEKRIFSCTTVNHKVVEVCDAGSTLRYSFGRAGTQPELVFSTPRAQASTERWAGVGRYMSYAVNLPHEHVVYSVFHAVDRLTEDHGITAGIDVIENGRLRTTVRCEARTVQQSLEEFELETGR